MKTTDVKTATKPAKPKMRLTAEDVEALASEVQLALTDAADLAEEAEDICDGDSGGARRNLRQVRTSLKRVLATLADL